jgi:DNA-binding transcriptional LysR family regulator
VDLTALRTFVEAARSGSLTAAASRVGYTQSAASRQVAALEAAMGSRLLERRARGVAPTPEGAALLPHAEAIVLRFAAARSAVDAVRHADAGLVRVGAVPTANAQLVPHAIAVLRAARPAVAVTLTEAASEPLLRALDADEIDLAVVAEYPGRARPDGDGAVLLADPLLVALPGEHPAATAASLRLEDLAEESWVEHFPFSGDALRRAAAASGFEPRIEYTIRDWTGKLGFVAAGLGLTLVPSLAASGIRSDVVLRDTGHPLLRRDVVVRLRPGAPPAAEAFADALARAAEALHQ